MFEFFTFDNCLSIFEKPIPFVFSSSLFQLFPTFCDVQKVAQGDFMRHSKVTFENGKVAETSGTSSSREDCWDRRLSCRGCAVVCGLWAAHSPSGKPGTGVLWVSTGTHPCDTSTKAGWWRRQSASSCVRACSRPLHCAHSRVCGRWF